ncbi:uncharacterized protein LOC135091396 [Scylla paramamosain]|uniref:uncharacterized protein LOC135091396 n=1 Tax=Scylla paramamosain TaxID=85552 RepID=UPI0030836ECB
MGDSSQSCRGFETPTLGNDLWPMGFDVDLALDAPGVRKGPGGGLVSGSLGGGSGGLNSMPAVGGGGVGGGYGDMHHLSGLSSILPRFDDLHPGDICQMTDLTNSLPKGDSETAQSLLAKLTCQDLGPDLSSGTDPSHKELESSLFEQAPAGMAPGHSSSGPGMAVAHKAPLESADVYGRITCFGGKLVLQLRHINVNTNYTLNVSVCWLCGEKVSAGSQLCTHKHSLHGMFQANDEYVQLDIEHYIIPDQALDPPAPQDVAPAVLSHPDPSGLHHDLAAPRDLELPGNLAGSSNPLAIGGGGAALQYGGGQDTPMVPPLTSAPNLMTPTQNLMSPAVQANPSCMNPSFGQLSLPAMPITSNQPTLTPDLTGMAAASLPQVSQPLCSANTPMFDLAHPDSAPAMVAASLSDTKAPIQAGQMAVASSSYSLGNNLNSFPVNNHLDTTALHPQPTPHREVMPRKHLLPYHTTQFMATAGDYTGHAPDMAAPEKHTEVQCLTPLHTVTTTFDVRLQRQEFPPRKAETGAKKRKSRAQRKPSVIQMKDFTKADPSEAMQMKPFSMEPMEALPQKVYTSEPLPGLQAKTEHGVAAGRQLVRPDASIDDWLKHNLQGGDLMVTDGGIKPPMVEQKYNPPEAKPEEQKAEDGCSKPDPQLSPSAEPREPDQTSRLAAHMLSKGIDLLCRLCSQDFGKDIQKYKIHMKEHGVEEMSFFACYFCPKTFGKGKHYRQHLKTHIRTRRFACRLCTASYSREAKLRRHVLTHSQDHQTKEYKCSKCPKSFITKEYLHSHMKIHAGKKFKCETCGYLCSSPFNLETHRMKHTDVKPFKCEQCEKTFVRRDFLDKHMEQVHKNKKSKCEVCGKLFSRKDVLKRHLAVHNNKTYDCEICAKKFSRKDRLATHSKVHKLRTDYKCSLCPASFTRKNVLDKHERIHKTKEQCKVCHKFLASKSRLESHMKLHEKESSGSGSQEGSEGIVKCEICEKSLTSKHILRKHMKVIHGKFPERKKKKKVEGVVEREKKFVCHWCSKGFTRSCNLNTHLLKAHSKDLEEDEFEDNLSSTLQPPKGQGDKEEKQGITTTPSPSTSLPATASYHSFSTSDSLHGSITTVGGSVAVGTTSTTFPLPAVSLPTSTLSPTQTPDPPAPLQLSSSHFPTSAPPDSPINLSTDAITAAAYLLAYPSYPY